jgi:DNA-binding MurR/RpiR family transcriptional regulator
MDTERESLAAPSPLLSGGIEARIRAHLPQLRGAERRVADQILANPEASASMSITEAAVAAGTSTTSVTRFAQAIGLAGYPSLKLELAALAGRQRSTEFGWGPGIGADISPDDSIESVLSTLVSSDLRVITQTAEQLDLEVVDQVVEKIGTARRIDVYAIGGSGIVADDFALRVQNLGIFVNVWKDVHSAIVSSALLGPADLAIGVSHSGGTAEVIETMTSASSRGATTVAITSFPRSPIGVLADLVLTTTAGDLTYGGDAYVARNAQALVLDLVFLRVAQRHHDIAEANLQAASEAVRKHNHLHRPDPSR